MLAYGQTGSGKTYTMGTTELAGLTTEEYGVVPRVIQFVFDEIEKRKEKAEFVVKCTFLEIYNEELHDLLDPATCMTSETMTQYMIQKNQKEITIREEKEGQISVYGLQEEKIESPDDLFSCLEKGSNFRSTSATLMNACSSRSHAIFTITIEQHIIEDLYQANEVPVESNGKPLKVKEDDPTTRDEFMVAKFHFVDLAGSERLKKTGATGTTMKEGISINKGLLSLGNVISALTDENNRVFHIPYRDSKLTRILQDSLGGNSRTTMIACISPAEYNYEESLNTLKYAARARNIKNKPVMNRDPNSALIAQLRQNVYELQKDIIAYKKTLISNNIELPSDIVVTNEEMQLEFANRDLRTKVITSSPAKRGSAGSTPTGTAMSGRELLEFEYQLRDLKIEVSKKEKTITQLQIDLDLAREEVEDMGAKYFACQRERDLLKIKTERLENMLKEAGLWNDSEMEQRDEIEENNEIKLVEEYHEKIEEYKRIADEKEKIIRHLSTQHSDLTKKADEESTLLQEKALLCEKLKRDLSNLEKEHLKLQKRLKMSPAEKHAERIQAARVGRSGYATQKEQRRENLKTIMEHGRKLKKHQEWMSKELNNTIANFNDLFINNLSQSLTQIFIDKDKKDEVHSDHESEGEDEEEEEEGDDVFEVEVVGQKAQEIERAIRAEEDHNLEIPDELDVDDNLDEEELKTEVIPETEDELINSNIEAQTKSKEMQDHIFEQEKTVIKIEGSLKEREKLLEAVKESHSLMQNSLLEEMKKEYFKKVKEMEYEIEKLKADHKLSIRGATSLDHKTSIEEQYKQKMNEFEEKLAHFKQKEKEQKKMEKEVVKQTNKIRVLENDIEKIRNQKVSLNRKLKEYDEKYRKWKTDKSNELIMIKKSSVAKDREINNLKREKRKNELLAQRKAAELKLLKKKHLDEEKSRKKDAARKKRTVKNKVKVKNVIRGSTKSEETDDTSITTTQSKAHEPSHPINIDIVREWIEAKIEKLVTIKHLQRDINEFESKKQQVEDEISDEQKYYSEISIKKEKAIMRRGKLKIAIDEGEALLIEKEVEEYDAILHQNQENIESLEDKIGYYNKQIIQLEEAIDLENKEDVKGLDLSQINSVHNAQTLLLAFFNIILEVKIQRIELEEKVVEQHTSIQELERELKILRESKRTMELEFNRALQKRENEFRELEAKLMQEADELKLEATSNGGITALEAKRLEKKKIEQQYSVGAYEDSKRKLSKMMSQLERKLVIEEKRNITMANLVEQSKAEKEQYKQKYNNLRQKMKKDEYEQMRMGKLVPLESPFLVPQNSENITSGGKLTDYRDMRKERKMIKKQYSENPGTNPITDPVSSFLAPEGNATPKDRKGAMNKMRGAMSLEQSNTNVFDRLLQHSTITSKQKERPPVGVNDDCSPNYSGGKGNMGGFSNSLQNLDESQLRWNCDFSVENAHTGPIYSIATMENQLYTCSKKSLKIWDIDTMN